VVDETDEPEESWRRPGSVSADELRRSANVTLALATAGLLFCGPASIVALVLAGRARDDAMASGITSSDGTIGAARIVSILGIVAWTAYAVWWVTA
jgi:hypothetical protein